MREYKVMYSVCTRYGRDDEWEWYKADTPEQAIEMAIADRKEMSADTYGTGTDLSAVEIVDFAFKTGFAVYRGDDLEDWFTDFRAELVA